MSHRVCQSVSGLTATAAGRRRAPMRHTAAWSRCRRPGARRTRSTFTSSSPVGNALTGSGAPAQVRWPGSGTWRRARPPPATGRPVTSTRDAPQVIPVLADALVRRVETAQLVSSTAPVGRAGSSRIAGIRASPFTTTENTSRPTADLGCPLAHSPALARPKTRIWTAGRTTGPPTGACGEAKGGPGHDAERRCQPDQQPRHRRGPAPHAQGGHGEQLVHEDQRQDGPPESGHRRSPLVRIAAHRWRPRPHLRCGCPGGPPPGRARMPRGRR
jgi:hypothetical protein